MRRVSPPDCRQSPSRPSGRRPVLAVLFSLLAAASPVRAEDEAALRERLGKGEVLIDTTPVAGCELPEARMRAVVDAPLERVWAIIDKCDEYRTTMPRIRESKELSREGDVIRCRIVFGAPWPMKDLSAITVARHESTPARKSRSWDLESGDYKHNRGSWVLVPFDAEGKRTLVEYRLHSEPKVGVPAFLQEFAVRNGLPDLISQLRKQLR